MNYSIKRVTALFLALVIMFSLVACNKDNTNDGTDSGNENPTYSQNQNEDLASFSQFCDELFADLAKESTITLHSFVENPEAMGITDYEVTLGSMSLDDLDDTSELTSYLNRLKTFDRNELSASQQLVYDQLLDDLTDSLEYNDLYLYGATFTPTTGLQVQLPIVFAEYSFNVKKDIDDYITLVGQTYDYYKYLIEIEKLKAKEGLFMEDSIADLVIEQCNTFLTELNENNFLISTFNQRVDDFAGLTDDERASYKTANAAAVNNQVIPAYKLLIEELTSLKGSCHYEGGLCNKPQGKEYYEYLMKNNVGWSKSVKELDKMVDSYLTKAMTDMQILMIKDSSLMENFDTFDFGLSDPAAILEDLKEKIKKDFPTPPDVEYTIKSIDKSLEDFASPAMYFLPPVDNFYKNAIYINESAIAGGEQIYPTMAHEGYPGHMYQTTYFNNTNKCNLRTFLRTDGYVEGWASYCEVYSYTFADTKNESLNRLMADNYFATLLLYAKMDIGINYYGWDVDKVLDFLNGYGMGTREVATEIYNTMVSEPCNYPCYSIGCLAFISMRETAVNTLGDKYDAKEFHRFLMDLGPTTFDLIEEPFNQWMSQQKAAN